MRRIEKITILWHKFAKNYHGFKIIESWQREEASAIIESVFSRSRHTVGVAMCRQVGKTEILASVSAFLAVAFPAEFEEPFLGCVTSPEKNTSGALFNKIKKYLLAQQSASKNYSVVTENSDEVVLANGSRFDVFGLFRQFASLETKKSTREGRTYHLILRDEMHLGDDEIYKDELLPALATTGGTDVLIGNGGFRNCIGKRLIEGGSVGNKKVVTQNFETIRPAIEKSKNEMWKRWLETQLAYIEEYGIQSDEVQKNLFNKWIVQRGNFVLPDQLLACRRPAEYEFSSNFCDVGIDLGKSEDRTVLTLTDYKKNIRDWAVVRGEWEDQYDQIKSIIQGWRGNVAGAHTPQLGGRSGFTLRRGYIDATGAGDPIYSALRRILRGLIILTPVKFNVQTKDKLGKIGLLALEKGEATYPANHKYTQDFEKEMLALEKEYRESTGLLTYNHPKQKGAHDDFADSFFLSMYGMATRGSMKIRSRRTGESFL